MASFSQYHVRLFRDSFDTAWGFRLQGGKDLGQPLTIQRVFTGSPAEGELQRGDIIVSISERPAESLTHKQAQDLIKFGGGSISLAIKRPPPGRVNVAQPVSQPIKATGFRPQKSQPMPQGKIRNLGGHGPEFGSDFSRAVPQYGPVSPNRPGTNRNMLFQVQQSFESRGFGASLHIARAPKPTSKSRSPQPPSAGPDFGTDFSNVAWNAPVQSFRSAPGASQHDYTPQRPFIPTSELIEQSKNPAWSGSLRQTGVKQWEEDFSPASYQSPQAPQKQPKPAKSRSVPKKQQVRTAQPFNPAPRNIPISTPQGDEEGPRVVHLQYNSPMGLYSNENVQETFDGQTKAMVQQGGQTGPNQDGPRDWSQSTLYRMIQQDERRSGGGAPTMSSSSTTVQSHQQPVHGVAFHPGGHDIAASDF